MVIFSFIQLCWFPFRGPLQPPIDVSPPYRRDGERVLCPGLREPTAVCGFRMVCFRNFLPSWGGFLCVTCRSRRILPTHQLNWGGISRFLCVWKYLLSGYENLFPMGGGVHPKTIYSLDKFLIASWNNKQHLERICSFFFKLVRSTFWKAVTVRHQKQEHVWFSSKHLTTCVAIPKFTDKVAWISQENFSTQSQQSRKRHCCAISGNGWRITRHLLTHEHLSAPRKLSRAPEICVYSWICEIQVYSWIWEHRHVKVRLSWCRHRVTRFPHLSYMASSQCQRNPRPYVTHFISYSKLYYNRDSRFWAVEICIVFLFQYQRMFIETWKLRSNFN